ncbi:DUF2206 domain-containing protein [Methanosarcina sp. UBA411]|jgi:uncharacterized membrane protein|uniref:DUF2206 domain-containing protein n=1 Tax=Methanosarcina sp. UBA411 TaxID=1915589 RepID=UPI0025D68267|nr:DUF2206 domain-containing protein [Methanosarcina sp. UBA411]
MRYNNLLQITDLKSRDILVIIFSLQLSIWGLIILDALGFSVPGIRQFVGLIYLLFVPGILILQILNFDKLNFIQILLYTVGTSVSTLMFIGFFMNLFYPAVGISYPISITPLIATISAIVIILCIFYYFHNKNINPINPKIIHRSDKLLVPSLFLFIIPILSILGTYYVNYMENNTLLMLMISLVAVTILLIGFDKFIPKQLYPLAIWLISISLILHYTLITNYTTVHDGEFGSAKLVLENHIWKWNEYGNYNSILSVTLLPSIFSIICNIDLTWIYKIVFPIFLSLIPLGVYCISRMYLDEKMSFLSACFFLISSEFFITLSVLIKQTMATFFLILLCMALLDKKSNKFSISLLSIIFSMSLIVSHYGTAYLVLGSFIFLLFILFLTKVISYIFTREIISSRHYSIKITTFIKNRFKDEASNISFNLILLLSVFSLSWYLYISNSSFLHSIISVFHNIWKTLLSDFFSPEYSRGAYMLTKNSIGLRAVNKYLRLGVVILIIIGFFKETLNSKKPKFGITYFSISIYYLLLLIASVAIPYFSVMSPGRLYILGLCFLSPLFVIGGLQRNFENKSIKILYAFVTILMLFNTQFLYVLAQDSPTSLSIGQEYIKKYGDEDDKATFYSNMITEYDILSLEWLSKYGYKDKGLFFTAGYTQVGSVYHNMGFFPKNKMYGEYIDCYKELRNSDKYKYIMLIYANVVEDIGFSTEMNTTTFSYFNFSEFKPVLEKRNKIYDNSGSEILWN